MDIWMTRKNTLFFILLSLCLAFHLSATSPSEQPLLSQNGSWDDVWQSLDTLENETQNIQDLSKTQDKQITELESALKDVTERYKASEKRCEVLNASIMKWQVCSITLGVTLGVSLAVMIPIMAVQNNANR